MATIILGAALPAAEDRNLIRNGSFAEGLAHWELSEGEGTGRIVSLGEGLAPAALELDGRLIHHGTTAAASELAPVAPLASYRLGWMVRRLRGSGYRYHVNVTFFDARRQALDDYHVTTGVAVGPDWEQKSVRLVAPEAARFARLAVSMEMGHWDRNVMQFTGLSLAPIESAGEARLEIDLIAEPLAPAGAPARLAVRIENRGDLPADDVGVRLTLPRGVTSSDALEYRAGRLSYHEVTSRTLTLRGYPADSEEKIRVVAGATVAGARREFTQAVPAFLSIAREVTTATAQLGPPAAPATRVKLGSYYFPCMMVWGNARNRDAAEFAHLTPRLGYYDEARPEVSDWHIQWARAHGISFFAIDWYWNQGHEYLNQALDEGLLNSRFAGDMEFCIHWCNADASNTEFRPLDHSPETMRELALTLCRRYFHRSNYLRVEGKPVLIILMPGRIANANGGWDGCARVLDQMREVARANGHPGLYLVAVQDDPLIGDFARGGFDAVTTYSYGYNRRQMPYEWHLPYHRQCFATARERAHRQGIDFIPVAWPGWDDVRWAGTRATRTAGNTPAAFRGMLQALPAAVEPTHRLALVEAWNEWGEGSVIEPGVGEGFGYLSAIRDALALAPRGPYAVPVPGEAEIAGLQTKATRGYLADLYHRPYARALGLEHGFVMDFTSNRDLWLRPDGHGDMRDVRIEEGALRGRSIGPGPLLLGPPAMDLEAAHIGAIGIRMSATAGRQARLLWINQPGQEWSAERSATLDLQADGRMHEYEFSLRDHPRWSGTIAEFRLVPADEPGEITIDWLRTRP